MLRNPLLHISLWAPTSCSRGGPAESTVRHTCRPRPCLRRFRFRFWLMRTARWLVPACRCMALPLADRRKRFLVPLWVFILGITRVPHAGLRFDVKPRILCSFALAIQARRSENARFGPQGRKLAWHKTLHAAGHRRPVSPAATAVAIVWAEAEPLAVLAGPRKRGRESFSVRGGSEMDGCPTENDSRPRFSAGQGPSGQESP